MALHDSLRDLVSARGPGVFDSAEEFRGILDDFLAEDEASLGELNLLVDAVRLGALRRVLDVLDHGAAPEAAIREAGAALARDRGTDDPTRSCWALASLAYALGKVDDSLVRMFRADAGTLPAGVPPTAPNGPAPGIVPGHSTAERPGTQVLSDEGVPVPSQADAAPPSPDPGPTVDVQAYAAPPPQHGAPPPVIHEQRSSRAGVFLLVVLVALLIGGLVAAGILLLRDDDGDDPTGSDDPSVTDTGSGEPDDRGALVPDDVMLAPYVQDGVSRVYRVDAQTGEHEPVTRAGIDARLPSISPDRRTMTYQSANVIIRVDLESSEERPLFTEESDCHRASRPSWSPDGSRLAVLCNEDRDPDGDPDGLWLANPDGSGVELLVEEPDVKGTPIWISETELIYGVDDENVGSTFWRVSVDGGEPEQLPVDIAGYLSHLDYSEESGRLLLLASPTPAESEGAIWTLDLDGGGTQLVVDGPYAHPAWSVDGTAIAATVVDDTGTEVLTSVVLKADGTGTNLVVPDVPPGEVGIPAWGTR